MSLWISSLKQLEPVKHLFTPLLWDFMEAAWPSPISLVVPRGEEMLLLQSSLESFGFETPALSHMSLQHHLFRGDISAKIILFGLMYIHKCRATLPCAGEWVDFLGMKDSAKYVGTPQSIAIRIPDCSVTTHLIDLVSGQRTLIPSALVTVPCHSTVQGVGLVSVTSTQVLWPAGGEKDSERLEHSVSPLGMSPLLSVSFFFPQ